jgi:hypothetical protein
MRNSQLESFVIKSVDKPGFSINETSHNFYGHYFYYPGQLSWDELSVTLVDPVDPDSSQALMKVLGRAGYRAPGGTFGARTEDGGLFTISKAEAVDALGPKIQIEQRGAENAKLETWSFVNPWIKSVKFGNLAYDSDAMLDIQLTIRYDFAELETHTKPPGTIGT